MTVKETVKFHFNIYLEFKTPISSTKHEYQSTNQDVMRVYIYSLGKKKAPYLTIILIKSILNLFNVRILMQRPPRKRADYTKLSSVDLLEKGEHYFHRVWVESQKGADTEDTYTLGDGLVKAEF